jgi:hypothetical protein
MMPVVSNRRRAVSALVALTFLGSGCIVDTRSEFETLQDSRPVGDVERFRIDVDLGVGRFELVAGEPGGPLYELDLNYDRLHYEPEVEFSTSGAEGTLRFDLDSTGNFPFGDNDNDLRLTVSRDVVLDLEISTGVGRSSVELDNLQVRRLGFEGGVGQAELSFGTVSAEPMESIDLESGVGEIIVHGIGNTRVVDFGFEGGVGSAELDFSGDWADGTTRVDVEVGIGEITIALPDDLVVEIETNDGLLTEVRAPGFRRFGSRYRRESDSGPVRVDMRIESGLGEIRIERRQ